MKVRITRAGDGEWKIGTEVYLEDFVRMVEMVLRSGGEMPIAVLVP